MKIKDLPPHTSLGGVAFKHPETGKRCYWHSQWQKGVWYKTDLKSEQVFPLHLNDLKDAFEFEVILDA